MNNLRFGELSRLYGYGLEKETEFYNYLRGCFFDTNDGVYCLWEEEGVYVSALRLEPYKDAMILAGLETAPNYRCRGFATLLVTEVLDWLDKQHILKVYSHIHRSNQPSVSVHLRCGFRKVNDCAVFLDGSASSKFGTYLYEMKHP